MDRDAENLSAVADSVRAGGAGEVDFIAQDLSVEEGARSAIGFALERFGRLDILVNNAGGGIIRPFLEHTVDTLEDAMVSSHQQIFQVWRTDADLRCFDLSLDPSDRRFGSVWGARPMVSNVGSVGFGRICTPVITSYSIHYTKLYDNHELGASRHPDCLSSLLHQLRAVRFNALANIGVECHR